MALFEIIGQIIVEDDITDESLELLFREFQDKHKWKGYITIWQQEDISKDK